MRVSRLLAVAAPLAILVSLAPPIASAATAGVTPGLTPYDARQVGSPRLTALSAGAARLRSALGAQGVVSIDPSTGTPRMVGRLDGFLTAPSTTAATTIALSYVASHADAFRLSTPDLAALSLRRDYVDIVGTHHLSWTQRVGDVPVFGAGVQANVTKDGRLINIVGSPVPGLGHVTLATPELTAAQARRAAAIDVGSTPSEARGDAATLVVFAGPDGPRLGWQTLTRPAGRGLFLHVVDATTGGTLYRHSLSSDANSSSDVTARTWDNYPGAAAGGTATVHDLTAPGWLPRGAQTLSGNVAHVYTDVNDNNKAEASEEIHPSSAHAFDYPFTATTPTGQRCSTTHPCSWDTTKPLSWVANRAQDATQVYYFLGKFHDHLAAAPIGFTRSAGNFEAVDGDPVHAEALDGANTDHGLPDFSHVDNANMEIPPDGASPRMQMYLWREPGDATNQFVAADGGDEADVVYHEYTHGLSYRLVVDANGIAQLLDQQSASMGEAWSDWYAMDYLVSQGYFTDHSGPGDIEVGRYVSAGKNLIRTQPMDCPVGSTSSRCPGSPTAGKGGYTYGDFGTVKSHAEVHADGEIWGETLWDIRRALGSSLAESLITRSLELSSGNPSFLDARNAILQADNVVNAGKAHATLWKIFAHRGMGVFASTVDARDLHPHEDFSEPTSSTGSLSGVVTDPDTHAAVAGVTIAIDGHHSGFPEDFAATTDAHGKYSISGMSPGTYSAIRVRKAGYEGFAGPITVTAGHHTKNFTVRRNWAASSGGGKVTAANGDNNGSICDPNALIDGTSLGYDIITEYAHGAFAARYAVVKLARTVDLLEIDVDPTASCKTDPSSSTKGYRIETSPDGTHWTVAATGTFTSANRNRLNAVPLHSGATTAVRYVRYTMLSTQVPGDVAKNCKDFLYSGCQFMDTREIQVFGSPS